MKRVIVSKESDEVVELEDMPEYELIYLKHGGKLRGGIMKDEQCA